MDLPTWYGMTVTGETATNARGLVAWLRESAPHSVHFSTLVFPAADLHALSLASVADRPPSRGYLPRSGIGTRLRPTQSIGL